MKDCGKRSQNTKTLRPFRFGSMTSCLSRQRFSFSHTPRLSGLKSLCGGGKVYLQSRKHRYRRVTCFHPERVCFRSSFRHVPRRATLICSKPPPKPVAHLQDFVTGAVSPDVPRVETEPRLKSGQHNSRGAPFFLRGAALNRARRRWRDF